MDNSHCEINKNDLYQIENVSRLYNIEPIGIGSPIIESLTSYVIRLAEAHSITPGLLMGKVITPLLNKHYLTKTANRGGGGLYKSASSLNGIKTTAKDLVASLEVLNLRNDFHLLTMLTWSDVFPTRGLLRAHKAWCPICLQKWSDVGSTIYEPLIWLIKEVPICPKHKIYLHTICPNCARTIPTLSRNTRHGYCSYCSFWLGEENESALFSCKEIVSWDIWRAENVGELLETTYSIKVRPDKERIKSILTKALEECSNGVASHFTGKLNIPISTFKSWMVEGKLPSIKYSLRIAYCLGISLKQFLIEEIATVNFKIQQFDFKGKKNPSNQKFPEGYIVTKLQYWATSNITPPPSVRGVATIIGCDRRLLYIRAPELCKAISQRYLKYVEKTASERVHNLKLKVIEAVDYLNKIGVYPSRRKVEDILKMPGVIKEEAIRSVWKQEVEKMKGHAK